jgi:hypothetical protein
MKSFLMTVVASAAAAVVLVACGGGSGGEGGSANAITTDEQAKQLAARTVHAVFALDAVAYDVSQAGQGTGQADGVVFGHHDVACAQGTGTVTVHDSDNSNTLSAGDTELFVLAGCQTHTNSRWALTGTPTVTRALAAVAATEGAGAARQAGATSVLATAFEASTGMTTRVTAQDLGFGDQAVFAGQWAQTWRGAAGAGDGQAVSQVQMDGTTLTLPSGALRLGAMRFTAGASNAGSFVTELQGQVFTHIEGLGEIEAGLSLTAALPLSANQGWYAPTGGVVKVTLAGLTMAVVYGADGAVLLQVDNGSDGTVDLQVQTSQAELDAMLMASPEAPPEPTQPESYAAARCDALVALDGPTHPCQADGVQAARIKGRPVSAAVSRKLRRVVLVP